MISRRIVLNPISDGIFDWVNLPHYLIAPDSRDLTALSIYLLTFGLSSGTELYQRGIEHILEEIPV
jgi:hypothetical protein